MSESPEQSGASREENGMNPTQAAEHLRVIRELMERPIRSTTRSGLSGVVAGVLALAGCAATYRIAPDFTGRTAPPVAVGLVWLGVLVLATVLDLFISWQRTRELGRSFWTRTTRQTALAIAPAFLLGGISTWIFASHGAWHYIPAAWMIYYGLAAWSIGMFSIAEVKVLGAAFIAAGVVCHFHFLDQPVAALAATFGGFHLVYGVVVWKRHGG
jgi:hypothetical protein